MKCELEMQKWENNVAGRLKSRAPGAFSSRRRRRKQKRREGQQQDSRLEEPGEAHNIRPAGHRWLLSHWI